MIRCTFLRRCLLAAPLLMAGCGTPAAPPTAASSAATATASSAAAPIVVQHAEPELTLEQPATRVVACAEEPVDFLLTLGVQPVGFCTRRAEGGQTGAPFEIQHFFSKEQLGTPTFVGLPAEPAMEEILKLQPDLIMIPSYVEEGRDQLQAIAPTMIVDTAASDYWRGTLVEVGKAVGREAEARQFLEEFDATTAGLRDELAPIAEQSPDVLFLYSFAASDGTGVFNDQWPGAKLLTSLGFNIATPNSVTIPESGYAPVSPEIVQDVDADIIMVIRPKADDGSTPRYPIDDLLDSLDGPRVIYQTIDPTHGSSAPLTDKFVLEEFAAFLKEQS